MNININSCCLIKGKERKLHDYSFKPVTALEISELFKIKITQLKMIRSRGYDISREQHLLNMNIQQFIDLYVPFAQQNNKTIRSFLNQVYFKPSDLQQVNGLVVYYTEPTNTKTIGKSDTCTIIQYLNQYQNICNDAIIIANKIINSNGKECLRKVTNYYITIFQTYELLIDPTEHYMVPKHQILTDDELEQLFESNQHNNINIHNFPYIRTDDAIIKYLGGKPRQVVKIQRRNVLDSMVKLYYVYRTIVTPGQQRLAVDINEQNPIEGIDPEDLGEEIISEPEEIVIFDEEGNMIDVDLNAPELPITTSVGRGRGRTAAGGRGRGRGGGGGRGRGRGRGRGEEYEEVVQGDIGTTGEFGIFGEFQGYEGFGQI